MSKEESLPADDKDEADDKDDGKKIVLTPEIVEHENRRIDIVLAIGILFLAFCLSFHKEVGPNLWLWLRTGQLISQTFPQVPETDPFTYTVDPQKPQKRWINPNWLFDLAIYQVYQARWGPELLVLFKSLLLVLTAGFLLSSRHRGPTLWGTVLCTLLAMVGTSLRLAIGPEIVTLPLLALLLLLWYQAKHRHRFRLLYLAIPLTMLWANLDATFVIAVFLLLLFGIGETLQSLLPSSCEFQEGRLTKNQKIQIFGIAGLCLLSAMITPYGIDTLIYPLEWTLRTLPQFPAFDPLYSERTGGGWNSVFGMFLGDISSPDFSLAEQLSSFTGRIFTDGLPWDHRAWLFLVIGCTSSCLLNYSRFSFSRTLAGLLGILLPMLYVRLIAPASLLLAVTMSLNCQEFYLSVWGTTTRISRGWLIWSQGGRALSVILLFLAICAAFTGRIQGPVNRFGWGIQMESYMTDTAKWLEELGPQGNGFAFTDRNASYRLWAQPDCKNFADCRWQLLGKDVLAEFSRARRALRDGQDDVWKEIFDRHQISYVIIDPQNPFFRSSLLRMFLTADLTPVHIDDQAVVFGRIDQTVDQTLFEKHRIDVNRQVFRDGFAVPPPAMQGTISAPGIVDRIWRLRKTVPPGSISAKIYASGIGPLEQPGSTYLAIRQFRKAVAEEPGHAETHLQLAEAYHRLFLLEAQRFVLHEQQTLLALEISSSLCRASVWIVPTGPAILSTFPLPMPSRNMPASRDFLELRHCQIMTCLQNALLAGADDLRVHELMSRVCRENEFFDLALEHSQRFIERFPEDGRRVFLSEILEMLQQQVDNQTESHEKVMQEMRQELEQQGIRSDQPVARARHAMDLGLPGLALDHSKDLLIYDPQVARAGSWIGGFYLMLGFPEKAFAHLETANLHMQLRPGEFESLVGMILALSGKFKEAVLSLQRGLARLRASRTKSCLDGFGQVVFSGSLGSIPRRTMFLIGDYDRETEYLMTLALLRIEMGQPDLALDTFRKILDISPHFHLPGVIAYYWELISDEKMPVGGK